MPRAEHTRIPQHIRPDWHADSEAAARRSLAQRGRYAFITTYTPVKDDAKYRSFDATQQYRDWCQKEVPSWLGYGRVG